MEWNNFNSKIYNTCPYKGLNYFDCNDEDPQFFFGREELINQLLDKIQTENFLAIVGKSGSGKSSVLRAGLLHRLKLGQDIIDSDQWLIRIFRPGGHPLKNLAMVFLDPKMPTLDRADQLKRIEDLISENTTGLTRLIEERFDEKPMVLVIDPFEDVFTLCKNDDERWEFFESLLCALEQLSDKLFLIITLRSDFLKECQNHIEFAKLIHDNTVFIKPFSKEELRETILKPAEKVGLKIEPELVTAILDYIGNSLNSLPLLQYVLKKLWRGRSNNCLTLAAYKRLKIMRSFEQKKSLELGQVPKFHSAKREQYRKLYDSKKYKNKLLKFGTVFFILGLSVLNMYWFFQSQLIREQAEIEKTITIQQLNEKLDLSKRFVKWQDEATMQQRELAKQAKNLTTQEAMLNEQQIDFSIKVLNSVIDRTAYHLKTTLENFTIPVQVLKNHIGDMWDNFKDQSISDQDMNDTDDYSMNGSDLELDEQHNFSNDYNELHNNHLDLGELQDELQNDFQDIQQAVAYQEKLLLEFPQNIDIQEDLAVSYKKLGDIQFERGQLKEAVQSFQQAIEINEKLSENAIWDVDTQLDLSFDYEKLADMQLNLNYTEEALVNFQKALDINKSLAFQNPNNLEMQRNLSINYENLGDVQLALNNKAAAFDAFQESLKISKVLALKEPDDMDAQQNLSINFNNLGLFFLQSEELDEAKHYFMQALKYGDQHDSVYFNLAQIEESKNHPNQALIWYKKINESLEYIEAQARITLILSEQGKWREAIQRLRAISIKSKHKLALMQMEAELLTEQKLYSRAMQVYNRALQINPKNVDLLYLRGLLAGKMNCMLQLERDLRYILTLEPNHIEALNALGYSLADRTDRYEEAYQFIKKVLDLQPDNHYVLDSMGWVLYKMGDYEQALDYLYKAQPSQEEADAEISDEFSAENAGHLGEVLWISGDEESAKAVWKKALEEFPENEKLRKITQYFIQQS